MNEWELWQAEQASDWLEHVRGLALDMARIQDRVDVLRSLAMPKGVDYSRPVVSSSPNPDAIPNAVARLEDSIRDYVTVLDLYVDEAHDAAERLSKLGDSRYRAVLTAYYVDGRTWEQVGRLLHYAPDHCRRLRGEALPLVYEVLPVEWRTPIPRAD